MYGVAFAGLSALFLVFIVEDFRAHRSIETKIWIVGLFLSIGGAFMLSAWHRASQQVTLLKSGKAGQAVITAVGRVSFLRSGTRYVELEYRYEPTPGQAFEATSRLLTADEAGDLKIGQRGDIKFDAENPARSAWIGGRSQK